MAPSLDPDTVVGLFERHGQLRYAGEPMTQLQHAWQCGQLARQGRATPALRLAAWLHDVGHLMSGLDGSPTVDGVDDRHESLAARALLLHFGPSVAGIVGLHVQAKRYLVATHETYARRLSPDSVRSLALQGGAMSAREAAEFMAGPLAHDALRLRLWDDAGKRPDWGPDTFGKAMDELRRLMRDVAPADIRRLS